MRSLVCSIRFNLHLYLRPISRHLSGSVALCMFSGSDGSGSTRFVTVLNTRHLFIYLLVPPFSARSCWMSGFWFGWLFRFPWTAAVTIRSTRLLMVRPSSLAHSWQKYSHLLTWEALSPSPFTFTLSGLTRARLELRSSLSHCWTHLGLLFWGCCKPHSHQS